LGIRVDVPSPRSLGPGQLAGRLPCRPVITPNPPENLDGDRVPDAVLLDYTGVECDVGTLHAAMAGTLGIEDPAIPGFGIRLIFSDLTRTVTRSATGEQLVVSWDGTRQIVGSPSNPGTQLNHTITAFRTDFTFPNGRTAQHVKNWNASFEADVAGSIDYGARLPSGTWSFDGNSTWVRNGTATYAIDLTTTTPLHYNTSCTVAPRFDAGMIVATVTRNGVTATVTIEHPACGQTLVTRTAAS